MTASILEAKQAVRRAALTARDRLDPAERARASVALAERILPVLTRGRVVSGFWPIRSEFDVRPLLAVLEAEGATIALPRIDAGALVFCEWRVGAPLEPGGFGTQVPGSDSMQVLPDVLLVPLAAFDRNGGRLGYGKGYYDGAITRLGERKVISTIGIAFSVQEVATVPMEPHDRRLDAVMTETETILITRDA
jgi:5-formyltetrahydrofolate cyclo-ligase